MNLFMTIALLLLIYMNVWFVFSLMKKRNDVADVAWGLGFVLVAWASLLLSDESSPLGILTTILVTVWGSRLAFHIFRRNKGKGEDYRYSEWRRQWGKWFYIRSYFQIYILQGILLLAVSTPVLIINQSNRTLSDPLVAAGFIVWLIGFFFEVVGDWQLAQFLKDPANRGKLMTSGLWAYTRHPNYFGEVTLWWGVWLLSLTTPFAWVAILGPLTITFLILKVSGIPMLEKKLIEHPDFAEYKMKTNVFFPWFQKKA